MLQDFTQGIKDVMLDKLRDVHTIIGGKIVAFDPAACEATVLPYGKFKKPDGAMMDYPQLYGVPVYVIQGNGQTATVAYPIKPDDECVILFAEQALDTWRTKAASNTDLKFDLSNAYVIVGMFARPNPLITEACADEAIIIDKSGHRVKLKQDGDIEVTGVNVKIEAQGDVSINAGGNISMKGKNVSASADKVISLSAPSNPDGVFSAVGWTAGVTELKP